MAEHHQGEQPDVFSMLMQVLEEQPEIQQLDLAEHEIDDLEPLVEIIAQLPNLEELNLSDNLFQVLPHDLSSW
jgi:Leucine-rich repeat (LRR) protein